MTPRFYAFWAINGALAQARLRRQLEQFRAAGFDGVVWHPRFYPNEPPYLSDEYLAEVSEAILHAKSLGLAFWIYDEDGWPSGTVGGQLLKKFPDDAQRWADLVPNTFNAFGPHHYYGGDWPVVSPDQIKGVRNFADPTDAPPNTHTKTWHFCPFQLPQSISILG